jgi:hypothetical protein
LYRFVTPTNSVHANVALKHPLRFARVAGYMASYPIKFAAGSDRCDGRMRASMKNARRASLQLGGDGSGVTIFATAPGVPAASGLRDKNYDCVNVTHDTSRDSFSRRSAALSGHG